VCARSINELNLDSLLCWWARKPSLGHSSAKVDRLSQGWYFAFLVSLVPGGLTSPKIKTLTSVLLLVGHQAHQAITSFVLPHPGSKHSIRTYRLHPSRGRYVVLDPVGD